MDYLRKNWGRIANSAAVCYADAFRHQHKDKKESYFKLQQLAKRYSRMDSPPQVPENKVFSMLLFKEYTEYELIEARNLLRSVSIQEALENNLGKTTVNAKPKELPKVKKQKRSKKLSWWDRYNLEQNVDKRNRVSNSGYVSDQE